MKKFFGYIRVSTAKQGEHGVSLQAQREAIARYATRQALTIADWFEERQTAAKRGRPVFTKVLKLIKKGQADGIIIHKIDRGARNLRDWADLGELIDHGVEVHFANESLDLHSRGGRLSADIQAVVAADYIRNLREETRKGFYGRLKQGLYPLPAPLGYVDCGKGKLKELDPAKAPLVKKAFELYSGAGYNLDTLVEELWGLGLRNRRGGRISRTGLSVILNNPFYMGLIRLRRTGEMFPGSHAPLISKALFDRVQAVLNGKTNTRTICHDFVFRRLICCQSCGYSLIGELQKGAVYYRCHRPSCRGTSVREDAIDAAVSDALGPLQFSDAEREYLAHKLQSLKETAADDIEAERAALSLNLKALEDRLSRLTDAYIDRLIDKDLFEHRKTALLFERKGLEERLGNVEHDVASGPDRLTRFVELAGSAYLSYRAGLTEEKREILEAVTSNRSALRKDVVVTLNSSFARIADRFKDSNGVPYRNIGRTWDQLLPQLLDICSREGLPSREALVSDDL